MPRVHLEKIVTAPYGFVVGFIAVTVELSNTEVTALAETAVASVPSLQYSKPPSPALKVPPTAVILLLVIYTVETTSPLALSALQRDTRKASSNTLESKILDRHFES